MKTRASSGSSYVRRTHGFTIVELLIVIIVIAILATITIVTYNGIQDRARQSQVSSLANQMGKQVQVYYVTNGAYPASINDISVPSAPSGISYTYTTAGPWYCIAAKTTTGTIVASGRGSSGTCSQVRGNYYSNTTFTGSPALSRYDQNLDFNWATGSPGGNLPADLFSIRWVGAITAPTTDTYTITWFVDDTATIYFNNAIVDQTTTCCTWRTFTYNFTAGRVVPLAVEMTENYGSARFQMHWSYTGQTETSIPASAFSSVD